MSDEEPVDLKAELYEKHAPKCAKEFKEYKGCEQRIKGFAADSGKNCSGSYNEYWKCMDVAVR